MPYIYSLSKYFWVFVLAMFGRLAYVGVFFHVFSIGVILMGNARFVVVTCFLHVFFGKNNVLAIGDLEYACCLSLERFSELPYLAEMYLTRPWYIIFRNRGSLNACISCWHLECR